MKPFLVKLLILLFIFSPSVYAQTQKAAKPSTTATEAIPLIYEIGTDQAETLANEIGLDGIEKLLAVVQAYKPSDVDSIYRWNKSTKRLAVNGIHLRLTTSTDTELKKSQQNSTSNLDIQLDTGDATTAFMSNADGKNPQLYVFLFLDKIFYDQKKMKRNDGNVRFLTAAAHEIYGNVTQYLKADAKINLKPDQKLRMEREIYSFQAGISFLDRAIAKLSKNADMADFVSKMKTAKVREQNALAGWKAEYEKLTAR